MLHPSTEQALRTQLAVALRERDEAEAALRISNSLNGHRSQRIEELEAQREQLETAARAYIEGHELALTRAEAAESALAAANAELAIWRDEDAREAKYEYVSQRCTAAETALAAATDKTNAVVRDWYDDKFRFGEALAAANARADEYRTNRVSEEARRIKAEEALAAARQECEGLREVVAAGVGTHGEPCSKGEDCQFMRDARAALATGGEGK